VRGGVPAQQRDLRPQGRRTVAQLLEAGVAVFAALGYQSARVEDVVRAANTSHGTFYLYFANKDDLLLALAEQCSEDMNHLAERLGPVGRGPEGRAELRAWIAEFAATYERHAAVIRAWSEQQVQGPAIAAHGVRAFSQLTSLLVLRLREAAPRRPGARRLAATEAIALLALLERFTYYRASVGLVLDEHQWLDTLAALVHRGFFYGDDPPDKGARGRTGKAVGRASNREGRASNAAGRTSQTAGQTAGRTAGRVSKSSDGRATKATDGRVTKAADGRVTKATDGRVTKAPASRATKPAGRTGKAAGRTGKAAKAQKSAAARSRRPD
jgi:AcrR family transcriptional regulator